MDSPLNVGFGAGAQSWRRILELSWGKGTYLPLLDIFERVGIELRYEIDDYFKKFTKS